MLPTRPTYHHGDLRNSLIRAALTLVAERGVDGFSLRGAARTVGVSPSACYRHFADREALLAAVAHEGLDTLAEAMRVAAAPYAEDDAARSCAVSGPTAAPTCTSRSSIPPTSASCTPLPKSEQSRGMMLPRTPAVLAQAGMDALVEAGVIAPEVAGRALLACWTSVHGLASLAVSGQVPIADGSALAVSLDAVLRTALLGAGVDAALLPPELPLPAGACPGIAELVRAES